MSIRSVPIIFSFLAASFIFTFPAFARATMPDLRQAPSIEDESYQEEIAGDEETHQEKSVAREASHRAHTVGETWTREHPSQPIQYQFSAQEYDPETGYYAFKHRYYDPRISTWVSADPILGDYLPTVDKLSNPKEPFQPGMLRGMGGVYNAFNMNLYHYAGLNPLRLIDPDGRETQDEAIRQLPNVSDADKAAIVQEVRDKKISTIMGAAESLATERGKPLSTKEREKIRTSAEGAVTTEMYTDPGKGKVISLTAAPVMPVLKDGKISLPDYPGIGDRQTGTVSIGKFTGQLRDFSQTAEARIPAPAMEAKKQKEVIQRLIESGKKF